MRFLLLGPLEAWEDGRSLPLGGPKQRTVLAHLLLQANRVVTTERLIDALWGDEPPETARNTLQTYVRLLRKSVGAGRIEHRSSGYVVAVEPEEVDVLRFQSLVERSRSLAANDLPAAITAIREALGLWRGPALDDLGDQPSLRAEIARLEEIRLAALEEGLSAELELGRHLELAAELEMLVGRYPYRERMWGDLILALYRSGRQGDALNAYQRARTVLLDDLGIDPSPDLQRLQEQVLRQDPTLQPTGERLRGYRLQEQIGEGAFGIVYRAFQPEVGREVAVKAIGRRLADDPEFIRRFSVEAQLVARLEHPHIVPLYDYWREPDAAYLVMRFLRGGSLRERLARGPLDAAKTVELTSEIALALASAHRQGVIHRDVKAANILFDEDGNAYLSDFGIATDLAAAAPPGGRGGSASSSQSPEAVRGEPLTARTDVFGLGVVVYECLTGRHPFAGVAPDGLADAAIRGPAELRPDLPAAVDSVLARAMAVRTEDRYGDVAAFATALREALEAGVAAVPAPDEDARNPYKGLQAFREADAPDFFGREATVGDLVAMMSGDERFLAVVGPSGSGKSSLVRAGLVPALRGGAVPGSGGWFVVDAVPGTHPFDELAEALTRIAADPFPDLAGRLRDDGISSAAARILPDDGSELLLVVDQFEEVFSLVADEEERSAFLDALVGAVTGTGSRVRVVITLRADFYDRPLGYRGFGELLAGRTFAVTPLSPAELERAIAGPAEAVGIAVEPGLSSEIASEVAGRPGALPLVEYALTEVFEARSGPVLSLEAFHEVGGVSGALARRAERLIGRFGPSGQEATRQLFLRLVAVGEDGSERTRRRTLRSELTSLAVDRAGMDAVIDAFGSRRLLTFDRDPVSRGPTVEIAHEALLREWDRLRDWIDDAQEQLRLHARVAAAANEWTEAGRSEDYLLAGDRLAQAEAWLRAPAIAPSETESSFVAAGRALADRLAAAERKRTEDEVRLQRRSVVRLRALVAVLAAAALLAAGLTAVAVNRSREADRQRGAAVLVADRERVGRVTAGALAQVESDPELSLLLGLQAVELEQTIHEPVPAETIEVLHWGLEEMGVPYPMRTARVLQANGPGGVRGFFDMPVSDLANLALGSIHRPLSDRECERFLGSTTCPPLPERFPAGMTAEPIDQSTVPVDRPLQGTTVTIHARLDGSPGIRKEFDGFTARTGITVRFVNNPFITYSLDRSIEDGVPPDLAFFANPDQLAQYAEGTGLRQRTPVPIHRLMDLGTFIDRAKLEQAQSPYLVSLGTLDAAGSWPSSEGRLVGAMMQLQLKSLVWYPVPELQAAGYSAPRTWDELVALSRQMVADGRTPWCLGWRDSGGATGWPGTDWIENLVLTGAGPKVYDDWTYHRIPFESPPVRTAFERLGQILFPEGFIDGGRAKAARRDWSVAQRPMVGPSTPKCWLYQFPGFALNYVRSGSLGTTTASFPFPRLSPGSAPGMLGGGPLVGAFSDRPEVREVVRFLLGPQFGETMVQYGGNMSPNRGFDVSKYPVEWQPAAEQLKESLADDTFRFDASDLMPPDVGSDAFWKGMITYLTEGPSSLDGILRQIDAAWPDG
ncbi:MAG TPA: extracellular solute-binding protein [Actinomycetota bacterium]|nr:extracellular solute-binding protein [Actinomycetota bacterium]